MMGPAVEYFPTHHKTTSGLIPAEQGSCTAAQVNPCIRCGRCVGTAPWVWRPVEVNQAYAARDVQALGKLRRLLLQLRQLLGFVCPAKRPVTQMMSLAKAFYLAKSKKEAISNGYEAYCFGFPTRPQ